MQRKFQIQTVIFINKQKFKIEAYLIPKLPLEVILGFKWMMDNISLMDLQSKAIVLKNTNSKIILQEVNTISALAIDNNFLKNFDDIFAEKLISCTSKTKHRIILQPNTRPIRQKQYKLSENQRKSLDKQIDDMLKRNIIEHSNSPWASPVVMVPKNEDFRLCGDYRKLNAITIHDSYPLPLIDDLLNALAKSTVFSVCDALSGYHQNIVNRLSRGNKVINSSWMLPPNCHPRNII
jgi:hypothetical protein